MVMVLLWSCDSLPLWLVSAARMSQTSPRSTSPGVGKMAWTSSGGKTEKQNDQLPLVHINSCFVHLIYNPVLSSPYFINVWFISSSILSILSTQSMLTLYKRPAAPLWSSWQQHNWGHCCTGQEQRSYILSWPHPPETQSLLCTAQPQRLMQSGRADYLWSKRWTLLLEKRRPPGRNGVPLHHISICSHCFTCQGSGLKECILEQVVCHQLSAVDNCISCNVWSCTCVMMKKVCLKKWKEML